MTSGPQPPINLFKFLISLLCLLPAGWLFYAEQHGTLGANPVETVQRWTGTWTLNLLLLTLAISPLRAVTELHWLIRVRRTLGLFSFFYAAIHFLSYIGFDHGFSLSALTTDVLKRPFVTVGFAAFVLMLPLAATSNNWAIRRLGGRRWQALHRSIYLIAILGCLHYFWLSKITQFYWPLTYALILVLLLGWRVVHWRQRATLGIRAIQPLQFFSQRPK